MKSYRKILKSIFVALSAFGAMATPWAVWGSTIHLQEGTSHLICSITGDTIVGPTGNIYAPVATGCLPVLPEDSSPPVPDTPLTGTCGDTPANVTIVDTGTFDTSWPQHTVSPAPQSIFAYKVVVPVGVSAVNTFSTARTSAGNRAKLLVVSECPGSFEPVDGQDRCTAPNPQETSTVSLTTIENKYRCNLTPGTYYVNAVSKASLDATEFSCSNKTECSFFVVRKVN